jgi:3-deoxy-D-manno-octulosonate 8-phosphate phosphatase (KDO 8-P phosphatase)
MQNLANIRMLVLDVDGVLTDGTLVINSDGTETKFFNSLDGHGIKMWQRAGLEAAILSGRLSGPTRHRAKQLEIEHVFEDCHNKLPVLEEFLKKINLPPEAVAYMGDDVVDLPVMRYVGFSVAVANAVDEVKKYADYVTMRTGGNGAVREAIEYILKKSGKWQELMKRYLD